MEKEKIVSELNEVTDKISDLQLTKRIEIKQQHDEKIQPLLKQIADLKDEIDKSVYTKYAAELNGLNNKRQRLTDLLDNIRIQQAQNIWYPLGTKVYLWETKKSSYSWSGYERVKTNTTGVVCVYDGSQTIAKVNSYKRPNKGDIIVMLHKKDGSIGLNFENISDYSGLTSWIASNWLAEGETPKDNILTRKEKRLNENEDIY